MNIFNNLVDIPLDFENKKLKDIFKDKNNKTLKDTISHNRYIKFSSYIYKKYSQYLDMPLGKFLYILKQNDDMFYKKFLNKYGDLEYSNFKILDKKYQDLKGVYFYYLNDKLKYIGRCKDSMKKRVNSGYGRISAKKCFIDGQATNCKVNALVTKNIGNIKLKIFVMDDNKAIEKLESELIEEFDPIWNSRK